MRGQQQLAMTDQAQVIATVRAVFEAANNDDVARFDAVIDHNFYIYEQGQRFDGNRIMAMVQAQHAAGKHFEWNVTEPDVHVDGNAAWIAYVNKGSITDSSGTMKQEWLESAFLQKHAGVWKIVFMHSTRVPAAVQKNVGK
jgi:hypothetical protein